MLNARKKMAPKLLFNEKLKRLTRVRICENKTHSKIHETFVSLEIKSNTENNTTKSM